MTDLALAHLEKLILLFRHFEGLNGLRDALLSEVARFVLARLTPAKIDGVRATGTASRRRIGAVAQSVHRRFGRSRRHVSRLAP